MKWLDYIKSWTNTKGKDALADQLVQVDPTANYHASQQFYASELLVNELPMFTLRSARLMQKSDPIVKFALNIRNAALAALDVEVTARDPRVKAWVERQWQTLWNKHRRKMVSAKKAGFAALQPLFKESQGLLEIDGLKEFAPEDVRPLESGGQVVGFKVRSNGEAKLHLPRACWLTFDEEYGGAYGNSLLRGMYPPWFEKWMPKGAKKLSQLIMIKNSFVGGIFWFPFGQNVSMPPAEPGGAPRQVSWRDISRGINEQQLSGMPLTLPMILNPNPGGTGSTKMLEYTPPQAIPGSEHAFDWTKQLDEEILRGADISIEVVKAQENGGFSGRSIPFMVLLANGDQETTDIVQGVDRCMLRPLAWLNFGGDPEYEIKPKSLVESFAKDSSGSAMGGSAIGSQAGEKPAQQPGQQPAQPQRPSGPAANFDEAEPDPHKPHDHTAEEETAAVLIAARAASRASRRIKSAAEIIRELKKNDLTPQGLATEVISLLRDLDSGLGHDLSASMMAGNLVGQAEGLVSIPPAFVPPVVGTGAGSQPPSEPPAFATLFPDDEPPPNFPALADAIEVLHTSPAVSSTDYLSAAQAVREGAFTITADITDGAVAEVKEILARGLEEGIDSDEFAERVIAKLGDQLSEAHLNNIFRTNTAAAMSDGHDRALNNPMVSDAFPYRMYFATTDQRVRKTHIALEHLGLNSTNIYRADDPVWAKFRPPWDYGCRCQWAPQTVQQAARAGVQEAQDWLARAKEMAAAQGGDFNEYLSRTAPAAPEWVQPPGFEPPATFER